MKIYRVSGLRNAGSASVVARAITALQKDLHVKIDVEEGLVNVQGSPVTDFQVASAVRKAGCDFLGALQNQDKN
ncbi:MAG TPA: cation-transporting ATPase [Alphaproteobacteria bacterium]|nr:cation-transporting ATPase [Alphaproteobacteria bacterium]